MAARHNTFLFPGDLTNNLMNEEVHDRTYDSVSYAPLYPLDGYQEIVRAIHPALRYASAALKRIS